MERPALHEELDEELDEELAEELAEDLLRVEAAPLCRRAVAHSWALAERLVSIRMSLSQSFLLAAYNGIRKPDGPLRERSALSVSSSSAGSHRKRSADILLATALPNPCATTGQ